MLTLTRDEIVTDLVHRGVLRDLAAQYAEAYVEYREASEKVQTAGRVVLHPVTQGPIVNPYLIVRDKALARLQAMRRNAVLDVEWLW